MELEKEISDNTDLSKLFDEKLKELNDNFRLSYIHVKLGETIVHRVKAGTYKKYRENKVNEGMMVNQIKTVRLINKQDELEYFLNSVKQ